MAAEPSIPSAVPFRFFSVTARREGLRSHEGYCNAQIVYHQIVATSGGVPSPVVGALCLERVYVMRTNGDIFMHTPHLGTLRRACTVMGPADVLRVRAYAVAKKSTIHAWPEIGDDVPPRPGLVLVLARESSRNDGPVFRFAFHLPEKYDQLWDVHSQWVNVPRRGEAARKRRR